MKLNLYTIGLFLLAILTITFITWWSLKPDERYFYLKLNGLRFHNASDSISIGTNAHVVFPSKKLGDQLIVFSCKDGYFHWKLSQPYYLKLNNQNINRVELQDNDIIRAGDQQVSFDQIQTVLSRFEQSYFFVSDLPELTNTPRSKSLFYKSDERIFVILLDSGVSLHRGAEVFRTQVSGRIQTNSLKLELIDVSSSSFLSTRQPLLNHSNINVPTIRTEWGSSHTQLKYDPVSKSIDLLYAQPLVIAASDSQLKQIAEPNRSRIVPLAQENALADSRTLYFERFSQLFPGNVALFLKNGSRFDSLIYVGRQANGSVGLRSLAMGKNQDIAIVSPVNSAVEAHGQLIAMNPAALRRPFVYLTVCFLGIGILVFMLTRESGSRYANHLYHYSANTDFSYFASPNGVDRAFFYLRLPVLLLIYILMCGKLIICTKLCFTHPYFPHLYPIGCLMALTTPAFIGYFWIKNSWSNALFDGRSSIVRILVLNLGLFICVALISSLVWFDLGRWFYESYFAAYDLRPDLATLTSYDGKLRFIFTQKHFRIPVVILLAPLLLMMIDLCMWAVNRSMFSKKPDGRWRFSYQFILLFGGLALISLALPRAYTMVYVALIGFLYYGFFLVNRLIYKSVKPKLHESLLVALLSVLFVGLPLFRSDTGFMINYCLVIPFVVSQVIILTYSRKFDNEGGRFLRYTIPLVPVICLIGLYWLIQAVSSPSLETTQRYSRRVQAVIQKDRLLETGGKQYLSDLQFLEIANLQAVESLASPTFRLVEVEKSFHRIISQGLYPVIINDLNPLIIMEYAGKAGLLVLAGAWLLLLLNRYQIWSGRFEIRSGNGLDQEELNLAQLVRFLPALLMLGNSTWLFLSLFNLLFFTGRVVNGFAVDSFIDWMDIIILAGFMGYVIFRRDKRPSPSTY
ncbi:hypothetical protein LZD49_10095 [Dyadobacter sp. CY261]|uniref:hypothetical protein n=1 Tax=Dyadobacter sp. CY261 TaxID=2907203 RepID=UPI001F27A9B4|nr:hypothetical protein [Dyadobacter sp. CY261]MCF0070823.1 hypothetical protein [Dyadobacter sp. CY261]